MSWALQRVVLLFKQIGPHGMFGEVKGWAAFTVLSGGVYASVAEVSVYVDAHVHGTGVGKKLLQELIRESEKENV